MSTTTGDRNYAPSRSQLLAATEQVSSAKGFVYLSSVCVTPEHWAIGHAIGQARMLIKKFRGRKEHENRGDQDERIDTEGALAEFLACSMLQPLGRLVTASPLVAYRPDSQGIDLKVGDRLIDVKSVGQGKDCAFINAEAHARKLPAGYLLCHFARADIADFYLVAHDEVSRWVYVDKLRGQTIPVERHFYRCRLPYKPLPQPECCDA